jgi:hypothetical protein
VYCARSMKQSKKMKEKLTIKTRLHHERSILVLLARGLGETGRAEQLANMLFEDVTKLLQEISKNLFVPFLLQKSFVPNRHNDAGPGLALGLCSRVGGNDCWQVTTTSDPDRAYRWEMRI